MFARMILVAALCLMAAPAAFATDNDADFGSVNVTVDPTVDVTVVTANVPLGNINANDPVCATVEFEVHANGQRINMAVGASYLYKDDIPGSTQWIPVDQTELASIDGIYPTYTEHEEGLPTNTTIFDAGIYGNINIYHTDFFEFGSGDPGSWSHPVEVEICWLGDNAELFQGRYSGAVVLWAAYVGI